MVVGLNSSALYAGIGLGTVLGGALLPVGVPVALGTCAAIALLCLPYLGLTRHHR
ncbi:hypothetical protein ACFQYP_35780 [Nonomuraea antimicrobica]